MLLKKYSPVVELGNLAKDVADSIGKTFEQSVVITNMERVVACYGPTKDDYIAKNIDSHIEKLINARKSQIVQMSDENTMLFNSNPSIKSFVISPILSNGDVYGSIIIFGEKNNFGECEKKIVSSFADYLSKQIE